MKKYRLIRRGHRKITEGMAKGIVIPCGWIIEKLQLIDNSWTWVYMDTMHPDDALAFMQKNEREYTETDMIDWLQHSPNPNISIFFNNWLKCNGGFGVRAALQHSMETSK